MARGKPLRRSAKPRLIETASGHERVETKPAQKRVEEYLQKPLVKMLARIESYTRKMTFFHVPNQLAGRSKAMRLIYAALGVRAGVPDLVLPLAGGRVLWIELKKNRNKTKRGKDKTSDKQEGYHEILRALGHAVYVVQARNAAEAQTEVQEILHNHGIIDLRLSHPSTDPVYDWGGALKEWQEILRQNPHFKNTIPLETDLAVQKALEICERLGIRR